MLNLFYEWGTVLLMLLALVTLVVLMLKLGVVIGALAFAFGIVVIQFLIAFARWHG